MKWIVSVPPFYVHMNDETSAAVIPHIEFVGTVDWDLIKQSDYLDDAFSAVLRISYRSLQESRSFLISFLGGSDGVTSESLMELNVPEFPEDREIVNVQSPVPLVFEESAPRPWVRAMEITITVDNDVRTDSLVPNETARATIAIKTPSESRVSPKPMEKCTSVEEIGDQSVSVKIYATGSWRS